MRYANTRLSKRRHQQASEDKTLLQVQMLSVAAFVLLSQAAFLLQLAEKTERTHPGLSCSSSTRAKPFPWPQMSWLQPATGGKGQSLPHQEGMTLENLLYTLDKHNQKE